MKLSQLNSSEEPVRLGGWVALAVGIVIQAAFMWTLSAPPEAIVAVILTSLTTQVGGLEWARKHAYTLDTVQRLELQADLEGASAATPGDPVISDATRDALSGVVRGEDEHPPP